MRTLPQACSVTSLDAEDLWQTERRSSAWNVGSAILDGSDVPQRTKGDLGHRVGRHSDWAVGDAFIEETDSVQLALMPVEVTGRADAADRLADQNLGGSHRTSARRAPIG